MLPVKQYSRSRGNMIIEIKWYVRGHVRKFLRKHGVRTRKRGLRCEDGRKRKFFKVSNGTLVQLKKAGVRFSLWARTQKRPRAHQPN